MHLDKVPIFALCLEPEDYARITVDHAFILYFLYEQRCEAERHIFYQYANSASSRSKIINKDQIDAGANTHL